MAPRVGLEPTTLRLTAECSAIELLRHIVVIWNISLRIIWIRRRPTLPGRFQPSTISVLRLNFCVRYGNRWIPQAIITGNFVWLLSTPWKPHRELTWNVPTSLQLTFRSSPRPISIIKLHPLPNFHRWPIYLIVSEGSYLLLAVAILFSRGASRLDAFSVYPFRTSLPSCALGSTTVAPEVRPSRSSRTRDSSCQNSCAHDG